jgi:nicotinamide mononucleotide adenylyltransferase
MSLGKVGLIGRFKPLHAGAALMLDYACKEADFVFIGIGSVNKYNHRNPFTQDETTGMIDAFLSPRHTNYKFIPVPDFAQDPRYKDGRQWQEYVVSTYGSLDHFITGNPYVASLLKERYDIVHPSTFIPHTEWLHLRAAEVRVAMTRGDSWQELVPKEVSGYITQHGLDSRFRKEFGLETLMLLTDDAYGRPESREQEHQHTTET